MFLPLLMFKIRLLEMPEFNLIISVREREREREHLCGVDHERMLLSCGQMTEISVSEELSACSTSGWAHEGAERQLKPEMNAKQVHYIQLH